MVRSTKAPKKRTSAAKSKTNRASTAPASLRNPRVLLFALIFGVVGVFALLQIGASPALPEYSDDIVAGYINVTPALISQDENGNKAFEMFSASTYVQADGTIVCDSGGTLSTVSTGQLSQGEVKKLQKDMLASGVTDLADEVGTDSGDAFVNFEGLMVSEGSEAKGTAVYANANKPTAFTKAQDTLQRLCAKATRTAERTAVKAPREPKLKKTNKKSAFTTITDSLFPKVSACCSAGTRDTAFEDQHAATINNWRRQNGRAQLAHTQCMRDKAVFWSDKMAKDGYISHAPSQNIMNDTAACHSNWRMAGENVGVGYDNTGLFNAFKASAAHNRNMLGNWRTFGVGAVRASRDNRIYVTQRYALY
jgi:uncharacterized protein YkwD